MRPGQRPAPGSFHAGGDRGPAHCTAETDDVSPGCAGVPLRGAFITPKGRYRGRRSRGDARAHCHRRPLLAASRPGATGAIDIEAPKRPGVRPARGGCDAASRWRLPGGLPSGAGRARPPALGDSIEPHLASAGEPRLDHREPPRDFGLPLCPVPVLVRGARARRLCRGAAVAPDGEQLREIVHGGQDSSGHPPPASTQDTPGDPPCEGRRRTIPA